MDKGEVVEEGTYSELMKKRGRFYQLNKENQVQSGELTGDVTGQTEGKRKTPHFSVNLYFPCLDYKTGVRGMETTRETSHANKI